MKKKAIKIALWSVSILVVLFIVLIVHIYMVTKPVKYDNNDLQLSRIDFKQNLDSGETVKVRSFVAHLPGVQNAMYNAESNTLVYGFILGKQTSDNVYQQLMASGNYNAIKFVPDAKTMSGGCPMGADKNSFVNRVSYGIAQWLNK